MRTIKIEKDGWPKTKIEKDGKVYFIFFFNVDLIIYIFFEVDSFFSVQNKVWFDELVFKMLVFLTSVRQLIICCYYFQLFSQL